MPVTSVIKDEEALTMTVVADFPVSVQRLWEAYTDPRQLEKFWGPRDYPATFIRHDVAAGGQSAYFMTGPDGEAMRGYWTWLSVESGTSFAVIDGFALADGSPNPEMPAMRSTFDFAGSDQGSRVTCTTHFNSTEDLAHLIDMGMEQGLREAMAQMDDVLADLATFAADLPATAQILSDTQVRVSRVIHGSPEMVWRAHHEKALVQKWMLGPDGWTMPVCEVASEVGEPYRYEWTNGEDRFGLEGTVTESTPPFRSVTTEAMIGMPEAVVINEMTLTPVAEGTLLSTVITYPNVEVRDAVLATGMSEGMEASYVRLEAEALVPA